MVLTLYKLDMSPPARAVMMTIEALNIPNVKLVDLNLFAGEHLSEDYLKMNPQHTIPTLKDDDFVIWDSHAICGYLVATYGKDDSLYPKDPKKRAIVDQRLHFDSGVLFATLREANIPILLHGEKEFRPGVIEKVQSGYEILEQILTIQNTAWLAGDHITVADICCVSTISTTNVLHLPIDKEKYSKLWAWFQRCSQQPFYKNKNEPGLIQAKELFKSRMQ